MTTCCSKHQRANRIHKERDRVKNEGESYLSKATLAQHHEKVEVGQFHAVPVAIAVEFGDGVGRGAICFAGTDFSSLLGNSKKKQ